MCVACVEPTWCLADHVPMTFIVCSNAWNRDSLNEIIGLIFEIRMFIPPTSNSHVLTFVLPPSVFSIFFTIISWAYYHQVRDPLSAANVQRAPVGAGAHPDHYNRPYDAEGFAPTYAPYNANAGPYQPSYAPPPGPPPSDMGYGVGMGAKERDMKDNDSEVTKFDDPFADFDGPSKSKDASTPPPH